ncbi:MAG: SIMPL domain-containing protein, partial [Heliobacteriaceae bacterium]|nr:SIMPL domain-containing protein [Heliobacteriaceae bacterium]
MKKTLAGLLVALFAGSAVIAATSETIPPKDDRGTLSLRTSANKEIAPDVADVTIVIQTKDSKSLQKAVEDNKEISNKIQAALKGMINPAKGDYIKTENYSASPDYYYTKDGKQTIKGYTVNNNIRVNTRELEKAGSMIDKSFELGATSLGGLNFSVSSYTK